MEAIPQLPNHGIWSSKRLSHPEISFSRLRGFHLRCMRWLGVAANITVVTNIVTIGIVITNYAETVQNLVPSVRTCFFRPSRLGYQITLQFLCQIGRFWTEYHPIALHVLILPADELLLWSILRLCLQVFFASALFAFVSWSASASAFALILSASALACFRGPFFHHCLR